MGIVVLSLAAIPFGVLITSVRDRTMGRRPRFWLRFTGFVVCMLVPWGASLVGALGDELRFVLLCIGLAWALLLLALAPLILFQGPGADPGPSDDGGGGPGPGDDGRGPDRPIGGIPLPDAEQSGSRLRGPHRHRPSAPARRGARERERK